MINPLVSIVIPVYNGSNYLAEAVDSALAQTYKNIEIVVVNDGSNDEGATEKVAKSYGDKIRYFSKENGGVSSALNLGIENMKGDYFSWLSHDDLYKPEKIEKQVSLIENENDIILCSGFLIDENDNRMRYKSKLIKGRFNGRELFFEFIKGYSLNGLGFLIPKKVFNKAGKFDESMRYLQDLDLWLRIMHFDYIFVCQDEMLVKGRVHINQTTNKHSELFDKDREKMAEKHIEYLKNGDNVYYDKLLLLYYYLFVKGKNTVGIKLAKNELKRKGIYNAAVSLKTYKILAMGAIKRICRKSYNIVLRLKNQRGKGFSS